MGTRTSSTWPWSRPAAASRAFGGQPVSPPVAWISAGWLLGWLPASWLLGCLAAWLPGLQLGCLVAVGCAGPPVVGACSAHRRGVALARAPAVDHYAQRRRC